MRYQVTGQGLPLAGGAMLAPAGTIIDWSSTDHFSVAARGIVPHYGVQALDDECYALLQRTYLAHLLGPPPPAAAATETAHKARTK